MDSLQSVKARSESFFAHHHPQRLLKALARSCGDVLGSLTTRSQAAIPSSALLSSPANLQRRRSVTSEAEAALRSSAVAMKAGASTEKRNLSSRDFRLLPPTDANDYLRWQ